MNYLKGIAYLMPTWAIIFGLVYFCFHEPIMLTTIKIIGIVFCSALVVILMAFLLIFLVWTLKKSFLLLFKINIDLNSKK